tara:strand:+ start:444 stop:1073 length:630 start_codon:yes stop_codon:yes gene_type:complete
MSKQQLDLMKPFGPWVAKINIPEELVNKLNDYVDKIVADEEKSKIQNAGKRLVGNVTQEFQIDANFAEKSGWGKLLQSACSKLIETTLKKNITKFDITDTWIVRQFENEYNPIHFHSAHLSGAGFLKVPDFGSTKQEGKRNHNGQLKLVHGNKQFLSSCMMPIKPKVGDFYIFPHYLMHLVYPFVGNEERRSISFNAKIDEDIFDVFKN